MKGLVIKTVGNLYNVQVKDKIYKCNYRGKYKLSNNFSNPIVSGDIVEIIVNDEETGIIEEIHDRKNYFLKKSLKDNKAHIINVGSIAGKEVYPKGNVYCASKFAVDALSEGMRLDLVEKNIKVSQINPGLVNTEFSKVRFKNDLEKAKNVYAGMEPLCADDIADVISFLIERPDNVNISDITILPKSQASSVVVNRKTNI